MTADPVLTLRDLESWSLPGVALAVLGHPIRHSLSPAMHNAALAELARDDRSYADWRYHRFEIEPGDLPRALELLHARRFRGVNLTVPHKVLAFGSMAVVDAAARPVGAVNTLRWSPEGWQGFNTDGYGLTTAVRETLGCDFSRAVIILLGAGGAARGAAVECLARGCAALWISNRSRENLRALLAVLKPLAGNAAVRELDVTQLPNEGMPRLEAGCLVINATSVGLHPDDPAPIDLALLPRPAGVYDMIYNPPRTALLRQAATLGVPGANGLAMLAHQGAKSLEIWTGVPAPRTAPLMLAATQAASKA